MSATNGPHPDNPGDIPGDTSPRRRPPRRRARTGRANGPSRPSASYADGSSDPPRTAFEPADDTIDSIHAAAHNPDAIGRYHVVSELGRGGNGIVWLSQDPDLRREVAVKVVTRSTESATAEFEHEAHITGQLEHPNIIPIYELGQRRNGERYLAMKRIRGRTLYQLIRERAQSPAHWSVDAAVWIEVMLKVCDAIGYAHSRGVLHRDLKPDNIMVGAFGEVVVMDWGIAKRVGGRALGDASPDDTLPADDLSRPGVSLTPRDSLAPSTGARTDRSLETVAATHSESADPARPGTPRSRLPLDLPELRPPAIHARTILPTKLGAVVGTPAYLAPESANGRATDDAAGDVFALGATLYHLLTLRPPYDGATLHDVLGKAARYNLEPPRQKAPDRAIPADIEAVCLKAMARGARERYGSVAAFRDDLIAARDRRAVTARPTPVLVRLARFLQRYPAWTAAVAAMVMMAAVSVAIVLATQADAARDRARAAELEQDRLVAEAERRQADRNRLESEAAAARDREARLESERDRAIADAEAAQAQQAAESVVDSARQYRDEILRQFRTQMAELRREGQPDSMLSEYFEPSEVARYVQVMTAIINAGEEANIALESIDYEIRGLIYAGVRRDYRRALYDFNRAYELAVEEGRDTAGILMNRATTKSRLGMDEEANADFARAARLYGGADAELGLTTVRQLVRQGRIPDALGLLRRMYATNAGFRLEADFLMIYGDVAQLAGAYEESEQMFTECLLLGENRDPGALVRRANLRNALGRYDDALSDIEAAYTIGIDTIPLAYEKGFALTNLGRSAEAIPLLERVLAEHSSSGRVLTTYGMALRMEGRHDEALSHLLQARRLGHQDALLPFELGRIYLQQERFDDAVIEFTNVVEVLPNDHEARVFRGIAYARLGRFPQAFTDLDAAYRAGYDTFESAYWLGITAGAIDEFRLAISHLRRAQLHRPDDAETLLYLAAAQAQVGDFDRALETAKQGAALDDLPEGLAQQFANLIRDIRQRAAD